MSFTILFAVTELSPVSAEYPATFYKNSIIVAFPFLGKVFDNLPSALEVHLVHQSSLEHHSRDDSFQLIKMYCLS